MEWLKKHWEIVAAIAVGIPLLYWLYQTYQANQAQANQDAADATANADSAASADQLQVAYGGYYSGSGGDSGSVNQIQNQPVTSTTTPTTTPVSVPTTPTNTPSVTQDPGLGFSAQNPYVSGTVPYTMFADQEGNPYQPGSQQFINYEINGPGVAQNNAAPETSSNPVTVTSMLFGTGSNNDTSPVGIQATTPDQSVLTHVSSGSISEHNTALPKTPTPVELSSLGGR